MSDKATKSNGKTAVKKTTTKKAVEKTENLELNEVQTKKMETASQNRTLAQQQMVMMNNAEQDILQLIVDAHDIDFKKVVNFQLNGNVLNLKMMPEESD